MRSAYQNYVGKKIKNDKKQTERGLKERNKRSVDLCISNVSLIIHHQWLGLQLTRSNFLSVFLLEKNIRP